MVVPCQLFGLQNIENTLEKKILSKNLTIRMCNSLYISLSCLYFIGVKYDIYTDLCGYVVLWRN